MVLKRKMRFVSLIWQSLVDWKLWKDVPAEPAVNTTPLEESTLMLFPELMLKFADEVMLLKVMFLAVTLLQLAIVTLARSSHRHPLQDSTVTYLA